MSSLLREDRKGRTALLTKNLTPGKRVYNEELILRDGVEYRTWDPFRSKLAAAILKGLRDDLVGPTGLVVGVEFAPRVAREFVEHVARERKNVIPFVADARDPSKYSVAKMDIVYCDIAQPDQTEIALDNCEKLLKKGGTLLLVVKARSIDVLKDPKHVFAEERLKLEKAGFKVHEVVELSPFEKDHALIFATN